MPVPLSRSSNTGKDLIYNLSGLPAGTYTVTAYFMETENSANRQGVFNIYVEGVNAIPGYKPASVGVKKAHTLTGDISVTDGTFNLMLDVVSGIPSICAISLVEK